MSKEATVRSALKLALEALESGKPMFDAYWGGNQHDKAITALREALTEQPAQQEPVSFLDWYDKAHWGNEDFKAGCWRAWDAALAQREWVGLTDEEVINVVPDDDTPMSLGEAFSKFAELIEAKLKEKNT